MADIGRFLVLGCVLCAAVSLHAQTNGNGHNGNPDGYEAHNVRMIPSALVKIDNVRGSHALIVDKSEQRLYLYVYEDGFHRVRTFDCTTVKTGASRSGKAMKKRRKASIFSRGHTSRPT